MALERVLEPEVMDTYEEARDYDSMDHQAVNKLFVDDLLAVGNIGNDILDVGTGTANSGGAMSSVRGLSDYRN